MQYHLDAKVSASLVDDARFDLHVYLMKEFERSAQACDASPGHDDVYALSAYHCIKIEGPYPTALPGAVLYHGLVERE